MSWEAMNWAGEQRTRAASTQCVLYVLANAADPDGVAFRWWDSPDHWWSYLVQRTRLKRSSLFRILAELEEAGLVAREHGPGKTGRSQPLVRLVGVSRERIAEPEPADESMTETEEIAREGDSAPAQSTTETPAEIPHENKQASSLRPSLPGRAASLYNPTNPSTHPKPLSPAEAPKGQQEGGRPVSTPAKTIYEPIGFNAWFASYPGHEVMDRAAALKEFVALSDVDRTKVAERTPLYAAKLGELKQRPKAAHLWLRKRIFDQIGGSATAAAAGRRVFVAQQTESWRAWLAVYAIAYGGQDRIPPYIRTPGNGGLLVPEEWPAGAAGWLAKADQWVFVEQGTPRYAAWRDRVAEITKRLPTPIRATARGITPGHRKLGAGRDGDLTSANAFGLFVPGEWPPPKKVGSPVSVGGQAPALSPGEVDDFVNSS